MSVIVRFAPSPTGYLHIGGARTALFNYLFARNKGGKFLLRVEDTDQKRSTKEAVEAIIHGLNWLGLQQNEEIVFQSKNVARHQQVAKQLLEAGKAYYCYTSEEELEELRENAKKQGQVFRFKSPWRDKVPTQTSLTKPVIRIKAPITGETVVNDLVQGKVTVSNAEIDDLVILRADGTPTYMLAVVVDDFDMKITHIIRGDDHLTNSFKQTIIYQAMGWKVPEFAHIPLIYGADGAKMSKRHGATSVMEYQEMGYLPEALRNYLLRLGWSHGNEEIISDEDAKNWFNLENIGKSPARFDFAKLDNLNKNYIKGKNEEKLLALLRFPQKPNRLERARLLIALKFLKERAVNLNELTKMAAVYLENFTLELHADTIKLLIEKLILLEDIVDVLNEVPDDDFEHDLIKEKLMVFCEKSSIKIKDFGPALRLALTSETSGAGGIFDVIAAVGKHEFLKRMDHAISIIAPDLESNYLSAHS